MAEAFFSNRAAYDAKARALTVKHAGTSLREWRVRLLGADAADELEQSTPSDGAVRDATAGGAGGDSSAAAPSSPTSSAASESAAPSSAAAALKPE